MWLVGLKMMELHVRLACLDAHDGRRGALLLLGPAAQALQRSLRRAMFQIQHGRVFAGSLVAPGVALAECDQRGLAGGAGTGGRVPGQADPAHEEGEQWAQSREAG